MEHIRIIEGNLEWHRQQDRVRIEPWGPDSVRVRATREATFSTLPQALLTPPQSPARVAIEGGEGVLINGLLTVRINASGWIRFFKTGVDNAILEEDSHPFVRHFSSTGGGLYRVEQRFRAYPDEHIFGLGQHTDGLLDQKGCVIELDQRNTQVAIPFMVSSRGYGLLWNTPSVGSVELGCNRTRWIGDAAAQIDYYFTLGNGYGEILRNYADATGHTPLLPAFASGFWQCKLRYRTQEELLEVAREYRRRGLPLSVIVVDFFHWKMMGDWDFDPAEWPDPEAMVRELRAMDIELMISVWPTINPDHPDYGAHLANGFITLTERGLPIMSCFRDTYSTGKVFHTYYDATNPKARKMLWSKIETNYYRRGIRVYWLDACEPEMPNRDYDNLRYHIGNGAAVGNLYPFLHQQGVYEGLKAAGEKEIIMLCRSAWAGSQRFGAAVWSGDIPATFDSFRRQIRTGLNMAMSGIPWWTTDIGGFLGGRQDDPEFRELLVRWFQYGAFCPLFRLHGFRAEWNHTILTGGPNEVWSYGEEVYAILVEYLHMRERLRPYIMAQMEVAHKRGLPPMRPLFVDFNDPRALQVDDEFMFGPDLLVAPVAGYLARERQVYLPAGACWRNAWTGAKIDGGQTITIPTPLNIIPLFLRDQAKLPILPESKG